MTGGTRSSAEQTEELPEIYLGKAELDRGDLLDALNAQPGSRFKTAVGLGLSGAAIVVVLQSTSENAERPWLVIGILVLAPLIARFGKQLVAQRMLKGMSPAQTRQSIEISADGVQLKSAGATSHIRWEQLVATRESPRSFLLYTSPTAFIILPKRAFGANSDEVGALLSKYAGTSGATARMWQPQLLLWALLALALAVAFAAIR